MFLKDYINEKKTSFALVANGTSPGDEDIVKHSEIYESPNGTLRQSVIETLKKEFENIAEEAIGDRIYSAGIDRDQLDKLLIDEWEKENSHLEDLELQLVDPASPIKGIVSLKEYEFEHLFSFLCNGLSFQSNWAELLGPDFERSVDSEEFNQHIEELLEDYAYDDFETEDEVGWDNMIFVNELMDYKSWTGEEDEEEQVI